MYFSVDRFEGATAVLIGEDGKTLQVPAAMLPAGTKDGDMLFYENKSFRPAPEKTAERRERIGDMLAALLGGSLDEEK